MYLVGRCVFHFQSMFVDNVPNLWRQGQEVEGLELGWRALLGARHLAQTTHIVGHNLMMQS